MSILLSGKFSRRGVLRLLSAVGLSGFLPSAGIAAELPGLKVLDAGQARQLLAITRELFPHDFLDDDYYLGIVATLDARAEADESVARVLISQLAILPGGFAAMPEAGREAYLGSIEETPFFKLVYNETLQGLYGNPEVARLFGYEGSSVEFGGYINRGFDDIDWLPVD